MDYCSILRLNRYSNSISLIISGVAVVVTLYIYGKSSNAAFKMPWIMLILAFPILGLSFYLLFGHPKLPKRAIAHFNLVKTNMSGILYQENEVLEKLDKRNPLEANQSHYLWEYANYPVYNNTDAKFYAEASNALEAQLEAIKQAEHFIFMEYHAIEETISFGRIREQLAKKAKEGVEVRILYDDMGSIGYINKDFIKRMEALNIHCRVFNPIQPILNIFMNNRDHRKITVIDGTVGFSGGYNLADEYFNINSPYGYWKDTGVKLTGEAVKSLTVMFLAMWNAMGHMDLNYRDFIKDFDYQAKEVCFVQPYADNPLDDEFVGENVYLNMIKSAKRRLYLATPYLIISDEMIRELTLAAKRGIDVRIITPGIPDKKFIYVMTRSYYPNLVREGVRIFEYSPGFIHEKQMLCDDTSAVVGTINMDYRSLYHHFENGVVFYGGKVIEDIDKDFLQTLSVSRDVTQEYCRKRSIFYRIRVSIIRLIAPLL